jgi:hypothetical protein
MTALTAWRVDVAARLAAATGLEAFAYPPPSLVPPCVVLLPGANYVSGPRRTGCLVDVSLVARLVTDVHESSGAFDHVDELVYAALEALPSFAVVNIGARTYGDSRYWCADITVTETAALDLVNPRALVAPS